MLPLLNVIGVGRLDQGQPHFGEVLVKAKMVIMFGRTSKVPEKSKPEG